MTHCPFYLVGAAAAVSGAIRVLLTVSPLGKKRRKRATDQELQALQVTLENIFCGGIPAGSIRPGSCNLQVLDYDTRLCKYLLTFTMLDATALEVALDDINQGITTNTVITGSRYTALPGPIGGFS